LGTIQPLLYISIMSMINRLSQAERQTLGRWYRYAEIWGYRTTDAGAAGDHSSYELRLHAMQQYPLITAVSDNVFRNVIQLERDNMLLEYDVLGKAKQAEQISGEERALCTENSQGKQLLREYFTGTASEFADELEAIDLSFEMSTPFEIIVCSALVMYAIAFQTRHQVTEYVEHICTLRQEYEDEQAVENAEESDSDYEDIDE
jgi:hypothetical protein